MKNIKLHAILIISLLSSCQSDSNSSASNSGEQTYEPYTMAVSYEFEVENYTYQPTGEFKGTVTYQFSDIVRTGTYEWIIPPSDSSSDARLKQTLPPIPGNPDEDELWIETWEITFTNIEKTNATAVLEIDMYDSEGAQTQEGADAPENVNLRFSKAPN